MKRIHLKDFAKARGQPEAATLLGITQGAVSKAIRTGRDVLVIEHADGSFTAIETRSFPSRIDRILGPRVGPTLNRMMPQISSDGQSGSPSVHPPSAGGAQ